MCVCVCARMCMCVRILLSCRCNCLSLCVNEMTVNEWDEKLPKNKIPDLSPSKRLLDVECRNQKPQRRTVDRFDGWEGLSFLKFQKTFITIPERLTLPREAHTPQKALTYSHLDRVMIGSYLFLRHQQRQNEREAHHFLCQSQANEDLRIPLDSSQRRGLLLLLVVVVVHN